MSFENSNFPELKSKSKSLRHELQKTKVKKTIENIPKNTKKYIAGKIAKKIIVNL